LEVRREFQSHPTHGKTIVGVVAFLVLTAVCLVAAAPAGAIIGGEEDATAHPYVGGLDASPVAPFSTSTGVLISSTVFLTPAHATARFDRAGLTTARVTFDPVASTSSTWYTGTVHTNPAYDPSNSSDRHDLGVIVFDTPVSGITPASLPAAGSLDPNQLSRSRLQVVGYGLSRTFGGPGGGMPLLDFTSSGTRIVADATFASLTPGWLRVRLAGGAEACLGDSGSPTLVGDTNLVAGITIGNLSLSGGQCQSQPWDARLDTPSARAFLGQYVTLP
jgi:Trypsin